MSPQPRHARGCTCSTNCQTIAKLEALGLDGATATCKDHPLGVCLCSEADIRREAKAAPSPTLTRAEYLRRRADGNR